MRGQNCESWRCVSCGAGLHCAVKEELNKNVPSFTTLSLQLGPSDARASCHAHAKNPSIRTKEVGTLILLLEMTNKIQV